MWFSERINSDFLNKVWKINEYKKNWINQYEAEEINMAKILWIQAEELLSDIQNPKLKFFFKKVFIKKLNIAFENGLSPTEYWEIKKWLENVEKKALINIWSVEIFGFSIISFFKLFNCFWNLFFNNSSIFLFASNSKS